MTLAFTLLLQMLNGSNVTLFGRFYVQLTDINKKYLEEMERKIQVWVKKQLEGKKANAFTDVVHKLQILCPKVGMVRLLSCASCNLPPYSEIMSIHSDMPSLFSREWGLVSSTSGRCQ